MDQLGGGGEELGCPPVAHQIIAGGGIEIEVALFQAADGLILQIENTCLEETSVPEDGNLSTTKSDKNYHGYGIGSIRKIVETYNGSLSLRKNDNMFILTAVFAR